MESAGGAAATDRGVWDRCGYVLNQSVVFVVVVVVVVVYRCQQRGLYQRNSLRHTEQAAGHF